ncbi:MAG: ferredoxin family protein [Acetobacter sp.]|nr:ferredoxin family protein [Acetobacter sp.]
MEVNHLVTAKSGRWIPVIDLRRCKGCGKCVEVCPNNVLEIRGINSEHYEQLGWCVRMKIRHHGMRVAYAVHADDCQSCGQCLEVCREHAIHRSPSDL